MNQQFTADNNPLREYFNNQHVATIGTNTHPWFCASHIAKIVGDANLSRNLEQIDAEDKCKHEMFDSLKRLVKYDFINESGLYDYLIRIKKMPKAKEFHKFAKQVLMDNREMYTKQIQDITEHANARISDADEIIKNLDAINAAIRYARSEHREHSAYTIKYDRTAKHFLMIVLREHNIRLIAEYNEARAKNPTLRLGRLHYPEELPLKDWAEDMDGYDNPSYVEEFFETRLFNHFYKFIGRPLN